MNDTERRVAESLHRAAERYHDHLARPLDLDRVLAEATSIRRRRTTAVVLASAAAIAVLAPAAVFVGHRVASGDTEPTGPAPTVSSAPTASPTSSRPTSTPTSSGSEPKLGLRALPSGPRPAVTYLDRGTVRLRVGGTSSLPRGVAAFTSYHGGWLAYDEVKGTVQWFDGSGQAHPYGEAAFGEAFAVSADGTRTAYQAGAQIRVGLTSGSSGGEQTIRARRPGDGPPVPAGFLSTGALVYQDGPRVLVDGTNPGLDLTALSGVEAVEPAADLVAGVDTSGRTTVVGPGGPVWHSSAWRVWAFSADGKYAVATDLTSNGDPSVLGILDARSGSVVSQTPLAGSGVLLSDPGPVFEGESHDVVFVAGERGDDREAIVRITFEGTTERTTGLIRSPVAGQPALVISAGP